MEGLRDYDTVSGCCEDEMTLKGSRFIGIVMPCRTEEDIQSNLAVVSKKYPITVMRPFSRVPIEGRSPATTGNPPEPQGSRC